MDRTTTTGDAGQSNNEKIFWRLASKEPIPIYLHPKLGRSLLTALAKKIKRYGGDPEASEDDAEVIICRRDTPVFAALTKKYDHERYKWVEPPSWVDECISRKKYEHPIKPPLLKPHTGGRSLFTAADDKHIVQFLAKRIPFKTMKGRSGQKVWKDLCERTDIYPWAVNHTWQSWRERYVKNNQVFDRRIEQVVSKDPDPPKRGGKGQYIVNHGRPGPRRRPQLAEEEEEEEEEEEIDLDQVDQDVGHDSERSVKEAPPAKRRRIVSSPEPSNAEEDEAEDEENNEGGIKQHESLRSRPSSSIPGSMIRTNAPIASTPAPFIPDEQTPGPEQEQGPLPSQPSLKKPRSKRAPNTLAGLNQTTVRMDDDDAPPASRTRAQSRQSSAEPSAQLAPLPTRTRRARATASPPPPPPPTLASQPETIHLDQLPIRKRDPNRPALKPALIPIPELSEDPRGKKRAASVHDDLPAWETLQADGAEPKSSGSDSSDDDDMSAMRMLNEHMRAITEQTLNEYADDENLVVTPKQKARKTAYVSPSRYKQPDSDGSEEESNEESGFESESEEDTSGDSQSGIQSLDTQASFPAVGTNARKYVIAHTPFTPARGTLAQEHVSSEKTVRQLGQKRFDKGKGRAW